ncbi:MAG: SDR family NAD(P)-dependent oxidoreductase [Streptosporangiaceae bacterium]
MKINGAVALVTGADRGLGRVYARELVSRNAAKVYGAARHPDAVTEPGVTPVALDITDPDGVAETARRCADVSLLVNNAGVMKASSFIGTPGMDPARLEMEVLADDRSRFIKASLSRDHELIYPRVQEFWNQLITGTG